MKQVETRQDTFKKIKLAKAEFDQEVTRLGGIKIEQTNNLQQQQQHIVYRPIFVIMTEKLINNIVSKNLEQLPKFGVKNNENVSKWLTDITKELNMVKLGDEQKLSIIQTFLVDDARRWFINNLSTIPDWSTFSIKIQKTFSSPFHQELALKRIGNRQQGLNETVLHYYNDMIELCDMIDIKMSDEYKIAYLKAGLKISLKREVMRTAPKTAAEFLETAQGEEKLESSLNIPMDNGETSDIDYVSTIKSPFKSSQQHQPRKSWQPATQYRCYRCNQIGHFARDCRSKNY
jgi:hypothetical protein